jgi:hypothetical protein
MGHATAALPQKVTFAEMWVQVCGLLCLDLYQGERPVVLLKPDRTWGNLNDYPIK